MRPFTLGAGSGLLVMVSAERIVPGALGRVGSALHPADTMPAAPLADGAATPADSAGEVPFVVGTPVPAPTVPLPSPAVPVVSEPSASGLLIPVQGVPASSLVDTYSQARGQGRRHDAIDIMAPRGTPVVAVADGVVMKLFQSERGGITLYELAPDRRTIYYYAHLDRYASGIAEGQTLRRGQLLGYVGNTGDAGPGNYHLHFEVSTTSDPRKYWGGTPQNPYPLLR
jgi:murein DD-endopeptidase MepM/ murein hydrolase activator NlpD